MATIHPNSIPPAPAVMRVLGKFDRQSLASFISVAIDLLDVLDGDPDLEATATEDDFCDHGEHGPRLPRGGPGSLSGPRRSWDRL